MALSTAPASTLTQQKHFFCIDNEMIYWNFYLDFGPLNLGHVIRFCTLLNKKLKDPKLKDKEISRAIHFPPFHYCYFKDGRTTGYVLITNFIYFNIQVTFNWTPQKVIFNR